MTVDSFRSFTSSLDNSLYAIDHPLRSETKSNKSQLLLVIGVVLAVILLMRRLK